MKPLISVIIPTSNRSNLVLKAVHSVLRQSYSNLECIIVNDGSIDDTPAVVKQLTDDRLIFLQHDTCRGASAARNTGIAHSKGKFIAFLDDDDEWIPTKLEKQVSLLSNLADSVGMIYCWMDYYDNEKVVSRHRPKLLGNIFKYVLDKQPIGNSSTLLVRRAVVKEVGGFDESLLRGNDGDFIRRVCLQYEVNFVPEVLIKVHVGHGHKRITRFDEDGIKNAIEGQRVKLVKFKDELRKYPRQTANIYAIIAYHYSQLGDWRRCIASYQQAIMTFPLSIKVYVYLMRSLKEQILKPEH